MSGVVPYFSDWQDRTMNDIKGIADADRSPFGELVSGVAISAKGLKGYQMKHSDNVVMGDVLEKMYTKHGAFKVRFVGHDVNSNILVACYQRTPSDIIDYLWLNMGKDTPQEPHSPCQGDYVREQVEDKKEERITRTGAIEDEWAVVNAAPKLGFSCDIKTL